MTAPTRALAQRDRREAGVASGGAKMLALGARVGRSGGSPPQSAKIDGI
jgi:hypothetical protein